jgi:SAM-dependent methyltransferase
MNPDQPLLLELAPSGKPHVRMSPAGRDALKSFRRKLERGEYELTEAGCICGGTDANRTLVAAEDRYGLPFRTYLCRNCGLLYASPRMSPESVQKFYTEDYRSIYRGSSKASDKFFRDQALHGRQILRRITYAVGKHPTARVFDVGCGAGGVLVPFRERGWECYGCDLNSDYLERGRAAGLTLEVGNHEILRSYEPAGLVIASHVLEHCLDPVAELEGWASLLKEDGLLYLEVPGVFNVFRDYKSLGGLFHVAHTFNFTLETLTAMASRAGLHRVAGNESVWALFEKGGEQVEVPPGATLAIESFLRQPNTGLRKAVRELRRHTARLARSGAKRLRFGRR